MAFRLFDAEARISLDDAAAKAGLKRFQKDFKETAAQIGRTRATAVVRADIDDVERKLKKGEAMLRHWERRRATAQTDADTLNAQTKINALHQALDRLERERVVMHVTLDEDARQVEPTIRRMSRALLGLKRQSDESRNILQRMGDALHNVRIEMGPLSLSLRGLVVALATLAPLVTSVGGALGALGASLSAAAAGAVGLGGALGTAFLANLAGVAGVVAPLSADLRGLAAAQEQYDTAVREAGRDSERAANALEKLRAVQDQASDAANRQHRALRQLGDRWRRLTRDARPEFVELIDHSLRRANEALPEFARSSSFAFTQAAKGARIFVDTFTGREATTNITTMMDRLSFVTPALSRGFANLGIVMLRVFRSFSRFFTPVAQGFRTWTDDLVIATGNTQRLNDGVDAIVDATKTWGGVMFQVSRLVLGFFRAALPQGTEMSRSLEATVRAWADWMNSKEGQRDTRKFLEDAISLTGRLVDFMVDVGDIWFKLATAARPFVEALVAVVALLGSAVNKMIDLTGGADGAVQAIAGFVVVRKALGWASELAGVFKGIATAVGAIQSGKGVRGVLDIFGKRGTTPANPLFVEDVTGGGGGGPGAIWKTAMKGGALRVFIAGGSVALAAGAITALALAVNKDLPTEGGAETRRAARNRPGMRPGDTFRPGAFQTLDPNTGRLTGNVGGKDEGMAAAAAGAEQLAKRVRALRDDIGRMKNDMRMSVREMATVATRNFEAIRNTIGLNTREGRELANRNFEAAAAGIARAMRTGRANTDQGMRAISRLLRSHSGAGKDALRGNMDAVVDIIRRTMRRGGSVTDAGLKIIRRLMIDELKMYGLSERQAIASVNVRTGEVAGGHRRQDMNQTGGLYDAAGNRQYARGGLTQFGRAGQRGQDTIQTVIAGQAARVAPGEVAAVFTGQQQQIVNEALMQLGIQGLPGLFERERAPHARGYQLGGIVAGLNPAISSVVNFARRKYGAVVSSGLRPGDTGSFHAVGAAADLVSGNMLQMGLGLANTFGPRLAELIHTPMGFSIDNGRRVAPFAQADHYDHVHAAALGRALAAAAARIKRLQVKGVDSPLLRIVQRNIDVARAAAQKRLDAITGSMMGGEIGTGFTGEWTNVMAQIAQQEGWNLSDWQELVRRESGGDPTAVNPSSGAFGLGQFLGSTAQAYAQYGALSRNPVEQIVAMAHYIKDRYGSPSQALAFHDSNNWYNRGGSPNDKDKKKRPRVGVLRQPSAEGPPVNRREELVRGRRRGEFEQRLGPRRTEKGRKIEGWWSAQHLAPWRRFGLTPKEQRRWARDGENWSEWTQRLALSEARAGSTRHLEDDRAIRGYKLEGLQLRRGAIQDRMAAIRRTLGKMPGESRLVGDIKSAQKRLEEKHKKGKDKGKHVVRGDARDKLEKRIKRLRERLSRRRGLEKELGDRRTSLTSIWTDVSSIKEEIRAEQEEAADAAREAAIPVLTNEDIEMRASLAALTPGLEDDIGVAQERVGHAEMALAMVQAAGHGPDVVTEAAQNVLSAREQLAGLLSDRDSAMNEAVAANAAAATEAAGRREAAAVEAARITRGAFNTFFGAGDIGFGGQTALLAGAGVSAPGAAPGAGGPAWMDDKGVVHGAPTPTARPTGGSTIIQHINTLHPGDRSTYDAIGRAATVGQAGQPSVAPLRAVIG